MLLHTVFSASKFANMTSEKVLTFTNLVIVVVSRKTSVNLGIPNVLLTLLGEFYDQCPFRPSRVASIPVAHEWLSVTRWRSSIVTYAVTRTP